MIDLCVLILAGEQKLLRKKIAKGYHVVLKTVNVIVISIAFLPEGATTEGIKDLFYLRDWQESLDFLHFNAVTVNFKQMGLRHGSINRVSDSVGTEKLERKNS